MTEEAQGRTRYNRINQAALSVARSRGWNVINDGVGGAWVLTDKAKDRANKAVTHQGRINAMERAAYGQSAG